MMIKKEEKDREVVGMGVDRINPVNRQQAAAPGARKVRVSGNQLLRKLAGEGRPRNFGTLDNAVAASCSLIASNASSSSSSP